MPRNQSEKSQELARWVLHPNYGWVPLRLRQKEDGRWVTFLVCGAFIRAAVAEASYHEAYLRYQDVPSPFYFEDGHIFPFRTTMKLGWFLPNHNKLGTPKPTEPPPVGITERLWRSLNRWRD